MDWLLCSICQDNKDKLPLRCPENGRRDDSYKTYKEFLERVKEFKRLNALPVPISFREDCTPETFIEKKGIMAQILLHEI